MFFCDFADRSLLNQGQDDGTIEGLAEKHGHRVWHKKCIHKSRKIFLTTIQQQEIFDGKDRRRRHEIGQGKRSQVC
jgi:hypothetical protein